MMFAFSFVLLWILLDDKAQKWASATNPESKKRDKKFRSVSSLVGNPVVKVRLFLGKLIVEEGDKAVTTY